MITDLKIPGYDLLEIIGEGGMAKVYLAVDSMLDRKVAIKVLRQSLSAENEEFKHRFFQEGKVLAKLEHTNIVRIYGIGEADGLLYMAMEYVDGGTLADRIKVEQLTIDEAIQICAQVGLALHITHLRKIVHRDLKPSNVLLRGGYVPVLTDFGIARQADVDTGLTQTGHIVGTMQYMSPEQIRGLTVDHRSDIYSLGLMFYRLLCGQLPFIASGHYELSRMQCEEPPPPLPPQMSELQPILDAMLAKDPEERFSTALDFCRAVQNLSATNEEYRTQLTQQTRIFDPSMVSGSGSGTAPSGYVSGNFPSLGSGRYSDRMSFRGSQDASLGSQRLPSGTQSQSVTGQELPGPKKGKGKWIALIGTAVALVLAVGAYFMYFHQSVPELSESDFRRLTSILRRVNADIDDQQLDEAFKDLEDAKRISADHPDVLTVAEALAAQYELDALDRVEEGDLDAALQLVQKGLLAAPGFDALSEMEQDISAQIAEREKLRITEEALALAAGYQAAGALIEPPGANAWEEYTRVIEADSFNETALNGLAAIEATLADNIREVLAAGDVAEATLRYDEAIALYPGSIVLGELGRNIAETSRLAEEQKQIEEWLGLGEAALADNRLILPESDSALHYFDQVLNLDRNNPRAREGLQQIADRYAVQAETAFDGGDYSAALKFAGDGLRARQDDARLLSVQERATNELGEAEQKVQTALQRANRIVQSVRDSRIGTVQVGNDSYPDVGLALAAVRDAGESVLEIDPANADAQRILASLDDVLFTSVDTLQRVGRFDEARMALDSAEFLTRNDARFSQLRETVEDKISQRALEEQRRQLFQDAESAIAVRPMTQDSINAAVDSIQVVRQQFPNDPALGGLVRDIAASVATESRRLSDQGSDSAGLLLVDRTLEFFPANATLKAAQSDIRAVQQERMEAERRRLAAISGQLAIDAMPWGVVEEIRKQDGTLVDLSGETHTPLVTSLVEGEYTILVRNDAGEQQSRPVTVMRQQTVTARFDFSQISADEYFERSGW